MKVVSFFRYAVLALLAFFIAGCGGTSDSSGSESGSTTLYGVEIMAEPLSYSQYRLTPLSDADFNALTKEQQYKVAVKLYASLYYGAGFDDLNRTIASGRFISQTRAMFDRVSSDQELNELEDTVSKYEDVGYGTNRMIATMLARLYHMEPGTAYLNRWTAYVLTQTILFSPAYELDTVYGTDAINVYTSLVMGFDQGLSLRWTTFLHMMSDENWRRFRSPEDNGREMMEIFLEDFNDAHVPLAAQALKNLELDPDSNTLVMKLNVNTEPITNLFPDMVIVDATDFYSGVVKHPDFLPTVCSRLVDLYFPGFSDAQKGDVVDKLVASNPTSWTDLLKQIVYSRAYLLDSHKPRTFEESFFGVGKAIGWRPHKRSFYYIARNLDNMHQSSMRYKLGRKVEVPLDSQSFAWFHKTIRESMMINYERNASFDSYDDGWPLKEIYGSMPEELFSDTELDDEEEWKVNEQRRAEYIVRTLFVPVAGREPNTEEMAFLTSLIDGDRYDATTFRNYRWYDLYGNRDPEDDLKERGYFARLVLDYLSRVSSVYEFEAVK
ncbi:hypothetical protein [Hydrogenimonas sp.]